MEKGSLKEFKVEKKINFKDLYFELIGYIESIQLDEPNNASNGFLSEEFVKLDDEEAHDSNNNELSDKNEIMEKGVWENNSKIIIDIQLNVSFQEKSDLDENLSDSEFQKVLKKKMKWGIREKRPTNRKNSSHIQSNTSHQ